VTDPVSRPEFENALEGIRRELHTMSEHIGSDLAQIRAALATLLDVRAHEGREVGEIKTRVEYTEKSLDGLHQARRQDRNNRWMLTVGVAVALLGHLLNLLKGSKP